MDNLEMLFSTAYERLKRCNQRSKEGSCYVFSGTGSTLKRPVYFYYALTENENGMDVFSAIFASPEWILRLDITWKSDEIYSLRINEEEADSLCSRNIWIVVPGCNIKLVEDTLLWWLTETNFQLYYVDDNEDEYI